MKILIITAGVLPVPVSKGGAVETLVEYIIDENEKYKKIDIELVSIFEDDALKMSQNYKNTKFYFIKRNSKIQYCLEFLNKVFNRIGLKRFINLQNYDYLVKLTKIIKNNHYDKIIIENRSPYVNYLKKITKDNLYLHLHNDYLNNSNSFAEKIYYNCSGILTVSDYIKNRVKTITKNDIKTKTLINCTNIDLFNKEKNNNYREQLRKKLKISEQDIVFLFSGRLTKEKGIKELLLAFEKLDQKNIKLLIIGSGWYGDNSNNKYQSELQKISLKLKDNIIFTGFIPRDDVAKYHSAADIALVPSMWEEPAGLVVLEAQASSLPLIITNSGGIPELVTKESAIVVNKEEDIVDSLHKAMLCLLKDKNKILQMGLKGRENAEKYNKKYYYDSFIKLLEEM
ncbi:MAG: glycosyltransferase family 4 protein [Fusobacteriaceae bacterium]